MRIQYNHMSEFEPVSAMPIKEIETFADNVFIKDARGNVWQFWIDYDEHPRLQCVRQG